jgi:hypothetical protein
MSRLLWRSSAPAVWLPSSLTVNSELPGSGSIVLTQALKPTSNLGGQWLWHLPWSRLLATRNTLLADRNPKNLEGRDHCEVAQHP